MKILKNSNGEFVEKYGHRVFSDELVYSETTKFRQAEVINEDSIDIDKLLAKLLEDTGLNHEVVELTVKEQEQLKAYRKLEELFDIEYLSNLIDESGVDALEMLKSAMWTISRISDDLLSFDNEDEEEFLELMNEFDEL